MAAGHPTARSSPPRAGGVNQATSSREAFRSSPRPEARRADPGRAARRDPVALSSSRSPTARCWRSPPARGEPAAAPPRHLAGDLIALVAPLVIGCVLALLLVVQMPQGRSRRSAPSPRASGASAWRSRPRAAASGSGTWTRTSCSCPTSPAPSWAGAAAASPPAEQVLERVAPEHRERVRQALAAARDLRRLRRLVPRARPRRPLGLDRRPRPGGRRARRRRLSRASSA